LVLYFVTLQETFLSLSLKNTGRDISLSKKHWKRHFPL
jgi:hypothetical protein